MAEKSLKTRSVAFNSIAAGRVTADRQSRGLAAGRLNTVQHGDEVLTDFVSASSLSGGSIPRSVDNSLLPCFPPVRDQGQLGSCASFSSVYYMGTHMLGLARGYDNRDTTDNSKKLSPKWVYNFVNGGLNQGSFFDTVFDVMLKNGVASWSDFPYVGSSYPQKNYREWSTAAEIWRRAIGSRFEKQGEVDGLDTEQGLYNLKSLLTNGYVCVFATNIRGWQFDKVGDDPSTAVDDAFKGQEICSIVKKNGTVGHAMTVVGYNDDIWVDLNKNGRVDLGEKGAFKIVNSWGGNWKNKGFAWISYDALRAQSQVQGMSYQSQSGREAAWWDQKAYFVVAKASYKPKLLAEFRIKHGQRSELGVQIGGSSGLGSLSPTGALNYQGGEFGFDGEFAFLNNAVEGAFVLDMTDLVQDNRSRYYLSFTDKRISLATLNLFDLKLTDVVGQSYPAKIALSAASIDNGTIYAYAEISPIVEENISAPSTPVGSTNVLVNNM